MCSQKKQRIRKRTDNDSTAGPPRRRWACCSIIRSASGVETPWEFDGNSEVGVSTATWGDSVDRLSESSKKG